MIHLKRILLGLLWTGFVSTVTYGFLHSPAFFVVMLLLVFAGTAYAMGAMILNLLE